MFRVNRTGTTAAAPAAGTHQVGDIGWLASSNDWGPAERNRANGEQAAADGGTLTINGTSYAKGVGAHADSAVHLYLGRACPLFTANVGVDDEVTNAAASVRFQVYGDGRLLAYSGIKRAADGPTRLIGVHRRIHHIGASRHRRTRQRQLRPRRLGRCDPDLHGAGHRFQHRPSPAPTAGDRPNATSPTASRPAATAGC